MSRLCMKPSTPLSFPRFESHFNGLYADLASGTLVNAEAFHVFGEAWYCCVKRHLLIERGFPICGEAVPQET